MSNEINVTENIIPNSSNEYLCRWGNWDDLAIHTYENLDQRVSADFFTEDNNYHETDIDAILNLKLGEKWDCDFGNHYVVKIA